jgi:hypothetical protein
MRTKRLIYGLDNNQKIRFIVNGFSMFCRVKDIENIASTEYRTAVWIAAERIGNENWLAQRYGKPGITGYGSNIDGVDVQVDLCDENTLVV